jgi:hypothetical protein
MEKLLNNGHEAKHAATRGPGLMRRIGAGATRRLVAGVRNISEHLNGMPGPIDSDGRSKYRVLPGVRPPLAARDPELEALMPRGHGEHITAHGGGPLVSPTHAFDPNGHQPKVTGVPLAGSQPEVPQPVVQGPESPQGPVTPPRGA